MEYVDTRGVHKVAPRVLYGHHDDEHKGVSIRHRIYICIIVPLTSQVSAVAMMVGKKLSNWNAQERRRPVVIARLDCTAW